jgi:molybdopterin/thiamine biosynthesis adenylyltransferase
MTERFARHDLIEGWSQPRLAAATVVIAGVGALGNEVAAILAMSGVGRLLLCDPDTVAESNLSRTVLFRARDIGRPKVEAAAEALRDLAPGVEVDARRAPFQRGVGLAELREAELVLGCVDSRAARVDLAARANLVAIPSIDGGTHPWGGEVRPFLERDGACYACALSPAERAEVDARQSCAPPPSAAATAAAAPSSAVVGSWMASVAIRFLMGLPVRSATLRLDLERGGSTEVEQRRNPECPLHKAIGDACSLAIDTSATVADLAAAIGADEVPVLWHPVVRARTCRACGFSDEPWRGDVEPVCPKCGRWLLPRSVLEIGGDVPRDRTLGELGIPPYEILAVRTSGGIRYVELKGDVRSRS